MMGSSGPSKRRPGSDPGAAQSFDFFKTSAAVFLITTAVFSTIYTPQAILPTLQKTFGVSVAEAGLLLSGALVVFLFSTPFYAPLSDRFGRKRTMTVAASALIVPVALSALAPTFGWLLFARVLQALFIPGITAVMLAYIHDAYPKERLGLATGLYMAATSLGGLLGRLLAGLITEALSWRAAFASFAVLLALSVVIMVLLLPGDRKGANVRPVPWSREYVKLHLSNGRITLTLAVAAVVFFSFMAVSTYATYYLAGAPFDLSQGQIGYTFLILLVGLFASPFAGTISDKIGRPRVMLLGLALLAGGAVVSLIPHYVLVLAGLGLVTAGMFGTQAVAPTYVGDLASRGKSTATALYQMFFYSGGALGTLVPGFIWPSYGYAGVVALCVALTLLTAAALGKAAIFPTTPDSARDRE